jgi:regulation of enolase protein 1 (concanavalin A-like superfamily)
MIKKSIICSILILFVISTRIALCQGGQNQLQALLKSKAVPSAVFKHQDIGNPSIKGTVKVLAAGIDINAGGADVWGVKDEFHFAYVERTGDFDLISRIESLAAANLYTKAGLMAREDLTPGCRHIFFQVFSDNNPRNKNNGGYEFQYRQVKDSSMKAIYPKSSTGTPEFPVKYPNTWIRLQRAGNDFTGYYSTDGKIWKPYTTFTLALPSKIYLGLAVTAHNTGHNATAKFRNIAELIH